jgi:protein-disulfide isomerase
MMKRLLLASTLLLLPMAAHAADLTPAEQKQIANLEAQIDFVNAANDKHIANIEAQIQFVKDNAAQREAAWRAKCTVAFLGIGCPPKNDPWDQFKIAQ